MEFINGIGYSGSIKRYHTWKIPFAKHRLIRSQFNKMSGQISHLSLCLVSSLQDSLIEDGNVPNGGGSGGDQELAQ